MRNSDYLKLLSGQSISSVGSAMSGFVFTLLALSITGSPVQAGLVGTASALGGTLMALPGGALADRLNRRALMVGYSVAGTLLFGSVAVAGWLDALTLPHLIAVGLLNGAGYSVFMPAETGALRQIVEPAHLGTALAANNGREHAAGLIGAPLGGLLYSVGRTLPIAVDAVSYLVMTFLLASIRRPLPAAPPDGGRHEPILRAVRTGLAFIFGQPALRTIGIVSTVLNFAGTGVLLVLILSMQQRGVPASVIGLLTTSMGVGGVLGAIAAPKLLATFSVGRLAVCGGWIVALALGATAFSTDPAVLIALPAFGFFLLPAVNSGLFGYQMLVTPDQLQGRAKSAVMFLANGVNPLAPLLGGFLLATAGAQRALLAFGALFVAGAVLLTFSRSIRKIPLLSTVSNAQMGA
ncbi:MFS transporter [Kribbella sandramycini]|uniref:MFS family permease n=1 Tax=Kribbella sandramycini TaxID=60450 RepID=A0A7Y4KZ74_9ACTN|nr:MFS transporter [Kribbella sandramycini]MBB6565115.1 MFS family permease [Kribbella sandramycini]NOL41384.1 MFS transporter [Kribbella sandramycini]